MADTASVRTVFSFSYRGGTKLWGTRWHFTGLTNPSDAEFASLCDNFQTELLAAIPSFHTLVSNIGYHPGSEVPVWSRTRNSAGTLVTTGNPDPTPGDCAVTIRWDTTQRTSKNHPIYLFNYFHGATRDGSTRDTIYGPQKSALEALADKWLAGNVDASGTVCHRAGPHGAVAQARYVNQYITHRDFPR
jgi:hypothetical protein